MRPFGSLTRMAAESPDVVHVHHWYALTTDLVAIATPIHITEGGMTPGTTIGPIFDKNPGRIPMLWPGIETKCVVPLKIKSIYSLDFLELAMLPISKVRG